MSEPLWPDALPLFDAHDAKLSGWEVGFVGENLVLQTGRCGDHFALVLPPGAVIANDGSGVLRNVSFCGSLFQPHSADCPACTG